MLFRKKITPKNTIRKEDKHNEIKLCPNKQKSLRKVNILQKLVKILGLIQIQTDHLNR